MCNTQACGFQGQVLWWMMNSSLWENVFSVFHSSSSSSASGHVCAALRTLLTFPVFWSWIHSGPLLKWKCQTGINRDWLGMLSPSCERKSILFCGNEKAQHNALLLFWTHKRRWRWTKWTRPEPAGQSNCSRTSGPSGSRFVWPSSVKALGLELSGGGGRDYRGRTSSLYSHCWTSTMIFYESLRERDGVSNVHRTHMKISVFIRRRDEGTSWNKYDFIVKYCTFLSSGALA